MAEQLAQWRRSGRETRYLTINSVNAEILRDSIRQLNSRHVSLIEVDFDASGTT